jgi:hypothetical protein
LEKLPDFLERFVAWSTKDFVDGRVSAKISPATARQICGTVQRFAAFSAAPFTLSKSVIFKFAEDLGSRGRTKKYVADQVPPHPFLRFWNLFPTGAQFDYVFQILGVGETVERGRCVKFLGGPEVFGEQLAILQGGSKVRQVRRNGGQVFVTTQR